MSKFDSAVKSKTFCMYPFIQMSTVPAGFMKPCCYFEDVIRDGSDGKMRVDKNDYKEIWNSDSMKEIRRKMANGEKVSGCNQCYREEAAGQTSMRLRSLKEWEPKTYITELVDKALVNKGHADHLPKILELKPGNLCNLKCRMCNKFDSNQIGQELVEISKYKPWLNPKDYDRVKSHMIFDKDFDVDDMTEWGHATEFWKNVRENIPTLERLGFAGGESSIIKEVKQTIRHCVETGHASHINVFYTSNLTRLDPEIIELGKKFRTFTVIASVDGVGKTQEYIRYPSKWSDVRDNFVRLQSHIDEDQWRLIANFTVQAYNICHLVDFLEWLEELDAKGPRFVYNPVSLNLLSYPKFLDIQYLPKKVKQYASRRLDAYWKVGKLTRFKDFDHRLKMIHSILWQDQPIDAEKHLVDFIDFTRILDEHRKQDLAFVDPFLYHSVFESVDIDVAQSLEKIGRKFRRHYWERPMDKVKGSFRRNFMRP